MQSLIILTSLLIGSSFSTPIEPGCNPFELTDVPRTDEYFFEIAAEAVRTVNQRGNEKMYPYRKLIEVKQAKKSGVMIDSAIQEAEIIVSGTNCAVRDVFHYRNHEASYELNCYVRPGVHNKRERCHTRVVFTVLPIVPPETQGVIRSFNCTEIA